MPNVGAPPKIGLAAVVTPKKDVVGVVVDEAPNIEAVVFGVPKTGVEGLVPKPEEEVVEFPKIGADVVTAPKEGVLLKND